jgi:hypothetical protein
MGSSVARLQVDRLSGRVHSKAGVSKASVVILEQYVGEEVEREHIRKAIEIHKRLTGERPLGVQKTSIYVRWRRALHILNPQAFIRASQT